VPPRKRGKIPWQLTLKSCNSSLEVPFIVLLQKPPHGWPFCRADEGRGAAYNFRHSVVVRKGVIDVCSGSLIVYWIISVGIGPLRRYRGAQHQGLCHPPDAVSPFTWSLATVFAPVGSETVLGIPATFLRRGVARRGG